jgi:hypothetical protein
LPAIIQAASKSISSARATSASGDAVGTTSGGPYGTLVTSGLGSMTVDDNLALGGFRTNITEQQLKDAPQFSDDSWQDRNWEVQWHKHYRAPHYWEMGAQ